MPGINLDKLTIEFNLMGISMVHLANFYPLGMKTLQAKIQTQTFRKND